MERPGGGQDRFLGLLTPAGFSYGFSNQNRNKKAITLNYERDSEAREILNELVKRSDVVIENYTPRVMGNFGLEYAVLREINPAIIMISMPGYGNTGPYRDYPAYGTSLEQHAGFSSMIGYPDTGPYRTQSTYTDPLAAVNAAGALMLALWHRRRTGQGQYIELAQIEASVCLLGGQVLDQVMNDRPPQRLGNRHAFMAPHGAYRCRGEDAWVSIAVATDQEWRAFCGAIGNPSWTEEDRFADQLSRWQNQDELDDLIGQWTAQQDHHQAMHILQKAGVAAGALLNARELMEDPHLRERGYFITTTHPRAGTHDHPGLPLHLSDTKLGSDRPSPCVGQHNRYVLGELLGMSDEEIARLEEERVISDGPILD